MHHHAALVIGVVPITDLVQDLFDQLPVLILIPLFGGLDQRLTPLHDKVRTLVRATQQQLADHVDDFVRLVFSQCVLAVTDPTLEELLFVVDQGVAERVPILFQHVERQGQHLASQIGLRHR